MSKGVSAQETDGWTLEECFEYALSKNIDVQKSELQIRQNEVNYAQSKSNMLPSVSASVGHNIGWSRGYDQASEEYGGLSSTNSTSYGVNSNVTIFNGFKLKTKVEQASLSLNSSKYSFENIKESVELNILNAYLNILYNQEEVNNAEKQIESTENQLVLANERLRTGLISKADHLQIKSELAREKSSLASSTNALIMAKLNLMQLMELPVSDDFNIVSPDIESQLDDGISPDALSIYETAMEIKPEIKEAELSVERTILDEQVAKADKWPSLSVSAGVNTGWNSNINGFNYVSQLNNKLSPSIGFSMSIPIFQKNAVKTNIKLAQISLNRAKLDETGVKNNLRKKVEQAVIDVENARNSYEASQEQYQLANETYLVAAEKFEIGLYSSIEFLVVKNDLITSESNLLKTKYNLVFSKKVLDFYQGIPISLTN